MLKIPIRSDYDSEAGYVAALEAYARELEIREDLKAELGHEEPEEALLEQF